MWEINKGMNKPISILDKDYLQWVKGLCKCYRQSQIKAAVKVNTEMLKFYWSLGRDIVELQIEQKWGEEVISCLAQDLREALPNVSGLTKRNIYYCKQFYALYAPVIKMLPQTGAINETETLPQVGATFESDIFCVPWGHHKVLIDKCFGYPEKAIFYIHEIVSNGWSRSMLLNFISTKLYERQGKALNNFKTTLPDIDSDLAQELTKDPYNFAFTGITKPYNERILKDALLNNITKFLTELGTGFAYVGKEFRLQIGEKENFIDLLFYNLNLSCYIVLEVKIDTFTFADVGQLGGYVVACNHLLRKEGRDNPTIGLLICKEKDRIQAQYALESSSQPIAISEYDLEKFYPEKLEGTMPTIEEWEAKLGGSIEHE